MAHTQQPTQSRRAAVLQYLRDLDRPAGTAEVAGALSVHRNTARFHLDALVETGQVERAEATRSGPGRPPQMFRATRGMDPTGPRNYRVLAEILASGLAPQPDADRRAAAAGRAWGSGRADAGDPESTEPLGPPEAIEHLTRLLDDLGFAPEVEADDETRLPTIALHHCPFLELARSRSELICPIHLELMRGALEAWQAPVTVAELLPFEQPDRCRTHLEHLAPS